MTNLGSRDGEKTDTMSERTLKTNISDMYSTCNDPNILLIFFADKCLFHNININVDSARTISPITSVQQCQYECQSDKKCLFFTYHMTADVCYLKQGFGTTVYGLEPYYISGPKYCGFMTGI